jgi:hypothetical protein
MEEKKRVRAEVEAEAEKKRLKEVAIEKKRVEDLRKK